MKKRRRGSMLPWWILILLVAMLFAPPFLRQAHAEIDCSSSRAWPDGPHLTEKNDEIVDLFFATWGNRSCQQWADEHRESAVKGLLALGYRVLAPVAAIEESADRHVLVGAGEARTTVDLTEGRWWLRIEDPTQDPWAPLTVVYVRGSDADEWERIFFGDGWTHFGVADYTGPTQVAIGGSNRGWTVTFQRVVESDYIDGPEWEPVAPWSEWRS